MQNRPSAQPPVALAGGMKGVGGAGPTLRAQSAENNERERGALGALGRARHEAGSSRQRSHIQTSPPAEQEKAQQSPHPAAPLRLEKSAPRQRKRARGVMNGEQVPPGSLPCLPGRIGEEGGGGEQKVPEAKASQSSPSAFTGNGTPSLSTRMYR